MATPSSTQKRSAASASTPASSQPQPGSGNTPRSVPSPAMMRTQQAGKTPSKTISASDTPTAGTPTPAMGGKHPAIHSIAMERVGSKAISSPLGGDMATPSGTGLGMSLSMSQMGGFDAAGGLPMGLGMSHISGMSGLGLSSIGRADDEEKRRRLEQIVQTVGKGVGRVSEEGLTRLYRRYGLGLEVIDESKSKTIMGAGNSMVVDVVFDSDGSLDTAAVQIEGVSDVLKKQNDAAGKILKENLTSPAGTAQINTMLDKFAENLDRLARFDKLSKAGANCFDAVAGIHSSLSRLYENERKAAEALFAGKKHSSRKAEVEVICKRSGRPYMHAQGKIGLSVDYWLEGITGRALDVEQSDFGKSEDAMDLDEPLSILTPAKSRLNDGIFSLTMEVEPSIAALHPPIRVSANWIADEINLPHGTDGIADLLGHGSTINWIDPPLSFLDHELSTSDGLVAGDAQAKAPDVRFVAKLTPPLLLPQHVANTLQQELSGPLQPEIFKQVSYHQLVSESDLSVVSDPGHPPSTTRIVFSGNGEPTATHEYHLSMLKAEAGRIVEGVPFAHPRQINVLLPTLRQYARLQHLLRSIFFPATSPRTDQGAASDNSQATTSHRITTLLSKTSIGMKQPSKAIVVDISLSTWPNPTLGFFFTRRKRSPGEITVLIMANGDVRVSSTNLLPAKTEASQIMQARQLERMAESLDACADLGVWLEWLLVEYDGERQPISNGDGDIMEH